MKLKVKLAKNSTFSVALKEERRMEFLSLAPPIFQARKPKEKYQVRFWSQPDLYTKFVSEVERNELVIQDVFNQFMEWFANASEQGALPKDRTYYANEERAYLAGFEKAREMAAKRSFEAGYPAMVFEIQELGEGEVEVE